MTPKATEPTWALDREIVLSRVYDAPRDLVFRAWIDKAGVDQWFGPKGFTCVTREMEVKAGGRWRFDYTAPDGQHFGNRIVFLEVKPPERLVFNHGEDVDDDPGKFRVTITFDEQDDKKTVVTLRQLHPTKAQRDKTIGFGAVEYGYQTLDKLAEYLRRK